MDAVDGFMTINIGYVYRADGTKLRKTNSTYVPVNNGITTESVTDYLDGFQYLSMITTGGDIELADSELEVAMEREAFLAENKAITNPPGNAATDSAVLQFVPTAEGFYDFTENKYIYQYKDHLGNTRLSYAWNSTTTSIDVLDKNDYYPFGMNHLNLNARSSVGQGSYKNYKYNGKELQETGMYDYGARFYMPDIGRWAVVDPLAEMYRRYSPYNYTVNNPINFTDPDGRWVRGAGFWNNITKSDARIHAEQASDRKNPQTGHYGTVVNKGDKKGTFEVTYHTSNFSYTDTYGSKGLVSSFSVGSAEGGGYGAVAPGTTEIDPNAPTFSSIPESRGKTDIHTMVSENPLVQGAVVDAVTGGIGSKLLGKLLPAAKAEANSVFTVTKDGVVLPKDVKIPSNLVENPFRASSYGEIKNGKFIETLRIDPATAPGMKGPNVSHFHINGSGKHIFDITKWPK